MNMVDIQEQRGRWIDSLTYHKNIPVSITQYAILLIVLVSALVVDALSHQYIALLVIITIAVIIQMMLWRYANAVGVSVVYVLVLGFMIFQRRKESIQGRIGEWVVWLFIFIIANIVSIAVSYRYIGATGCIEMTVAHCVFFTIGVLSGVVDHKIGSILP